MTTTVTFSGTPNTAPNGMWTLTATVSGTDGPYNGYLTIRDNMVDVVADGALVTAGVTAVDLIFNSGDHILYATYTDESHVDVPVTSDVLKYSIVGTGTVDPAYYPTDVQKIGSETLSVNWTPAALHDPTANIDNVYVLYWDDAWITDKSFPTKAHVVTLAQAATSSSYSWPAYDHTHTYNAMVIAHKQIIIDFGFGVAIIDTYYPVTAIVAPISGNQDPPPFWPNFSLGAQNGEFFLKFDPAAS